jgi:hypothetical protein
MRIKLQDIIDKVSKYHYFIYNPKKKKIISSHHNINIKDIENIKKGYIVIVVKLKRIKQKQHDLEKFSPLKLIGGPLYGQVSTYSIDKNKLSKQESLLKDKVYFPKNYIQKNWKKDDIKWLYDDIKKIALAYINSKIGQQLLAINTIVSINK